ncbi:MAG: hypothetical protein FJ191_02570 [Gammaproteobacteria bacterium]|nr:hypothetical protein [Gammaproteobacteria bacterium]
MPHWPCWRAAPAARRFMDLLAQGASRPWQDALEELTGSRQMDTAALMAYFQPLLGWLEDRNRGHQCGW